VNRIDGMPLTAAAELPAVRRRRESQRQEWTEQTRLAEMLDEYLDPADTFWTSLGEQAAVALERYLSKETRCAERSAGCAGHLARQTDLRRTKIARRCSEQSAEADPFGNAAGRRRLVAGAQRRRRAAGAASFRSGVPAQMEAAAAQAVGGSVRRPERAAAAGAGRGRSATGRTTTMAGASAARPRDLKRRAKKRCRFSTSATQPLGQIEKGL
jgi:hypothetical protein